MGGRRGARPVPEGRRTGDTRGSKTTQICATVVNSRRWDLRGHSPRPPGSPGGSGEAPESLSGSRKGPFWVEIWSRKSPIGSEKYRNDLDCVKNKHDRHEHEDENE